ncbi:hypothetical protein K2173_013734 [Erythroxylum novogranatense]|uniref:Uncharacterized protein n=1 Tax=Erythroxylum novogranatense TaxID=1862640 RepID=A0AAV8SA97_9ROSI|nr:hypothetical protein K2173_013734 [Erythroxylum novogranatense]
MVYSSPMAEFPPNLDDGELWLPSDIFINEVPSIIGSFSCMNDEQLVRQFAALSFLQNHRPRPSSNLAQVICFSQPLLACKTLGTLAWLFNCSIAFVFLPSSQRVKPELGDFSLNRLSPPGCFRCHGSAELGQRCVGYQKGSLFPRPNSFCDFRVQPQVANHLETSAWLAQGHHSRQHLTRVNPCQGRGFGSGSVGFVRDSGGTGVFHPRIVKPTTTTASDVRKKQGLGNRQEIQATWPRNHMTREPIKKLQEDCYYYLPPEMGLPQDWTY